MGAEDAELIVAMNHGEPGVRRMAATPDSPQSVTAPMERRKALKTLQFLIFIACPVRMGSPEVSSHRSC